MAELVERLNEALAGRYQIVAELGRGGMATVFRARDLRHEREVALKAIHPAIAMALGSERFLHEIALTARLQHPHILPLLESGTVGNLPFYVMPLVRGVSLRHRLNLEGQLPLADAIAITTEVADALAYAHREGLVHRDIKPENILLQDGRALVADFGIARELDAADRVRLTETGISVGTPLYMSPEQGAAEPRIDGRSDQYSLACVLYEMLAGSPPFLAASQQAVLARHARDAVPPITTVRSTVPPAVEMALERALAKLPADRFRDTGEFAAALTAPPPLRLVTPSTRRRAWWIGVSVLVVGLAAVGIMRSLVARDARPALDPHRIAVLPFTTRCTPATAIWCEGIAQLIAATFTGAGEYSAVEAGAVYRASARDTRDPSASARLAPRLGAAHYVLGSVTESGAELRMTARLFETANETTPALERTVQGPTTEIFRLVDDLAAALMSGLEGGEVGRLNRLAAATTDSLNALKLFLSAEARVQQGQFDSALVLLQQAVRIDSTFTLGWARLAEVAGYTEDQGAAIPAMQRALRGLGRLPWRDSMLIEASRAAKFEDADRLYRAVLARDSTDGPVWGALGDRLLHVAAIEGRSYDTAAEHFARAITLGDTSWRNVNHLTWAAGVAGNRNQYIQGLELALAKFPDGFMAPIHRLELAVARGDSAAQATAIAGLRSYGVLQAWGSAQRLATVGVPEAAEGPARLLTQPEQPLRARVLGYQLLATLQAAQGRWRDARNTLGQAAQLEPLSAAETGAYLALVPGLPVSQEALESLSVQLAQSRVPRPFPEESFLFPHEDVHPIVREYLQGRLAGTRGDAARAELAAMTLAAMTRPAVGGLAPSLAGSLRAHALFLRGRLPEALAQLEAGPTPNDVMRANGSPFFSQVGDRVLRAELLDRLNRPEEALPWFAAAGTVSVMDAAYLAHALQRSGDILHLLGRNAEARARYQRFVELWAHADPELQPLVDQVRQRLRSPDLARRD